MDRGIIARLTVVSILMLGFSSAEVPIPLIEWNFEAEESDNALLQGQIAAKKNVDMRGFSEVRDVAALRTFEAGAQQGNDYRRILGTNGRAGPLGICMRQQSLSS